MRNFLTFDGVDCRDFGVYISGQGTFSAPARAYEMQEIPGRNGALIGYDAHLQNTELTYQAFVYSNFRESIRGFRNFLLSRVGYKRLIDTYHPDEYRMACYVGPFEPDVLSDNKAGSFEIMFTCKPQRYLLSGENVITMTATGAIFNPTLFDAQPIMRVYGNGTIDIGTGSFLSVDANPYPYIDIDFAMMEAFSGDYNCNEYISLSDNDFPVIPPGSTTLTLSAGITKLEITPRWWQV